MPKEPRTKHNKAANQARMPLIQSTNRKAEDSSKSDIISTSIEEEAEWEEVMKAVEAENSPTKSISNENQPQSSYESLPIQSFSDYEALPSPPSTNDEPVIFPTQANIPTNEPFDHMHPMMEGVIRLERTKAPYTPSEVAAMNIPKYFTMDREIYTWYWLPSPLRKCLTAIRE